MKNQKLPRKLAALLVAIITILGLSACTSSTSGGDGKSGKKPVIALSNSFIGNSWRKQMVDAFTQLAEQQKKEGRISDFVVTNADGTVEQQISQINGLILKKVDAILIDAASPTALNGVIEKAEAAGIKVVTFDGTATSEKSYNLNYDFVGLGKRMVDVITKGINDQGNVLVVRGSAGTVIDKDEYQGIMDGLKAHPNVKMVGEVYGNWDDATAQSAVARLLPTLPKIDGVIVNGGGYGVAQAFEAAKQPVPLIYFGNRGYDLKFWQDQLAKGKYPSESASTTPSISTAAFWLALSIVEGATPAKNLKMDFLTITEADLAQYKDLPLDQVAAKTYDEKWVKDNLLTQK